MPVAGNKRARADAARRARGLAAAKAGEHAMGKRLRALGVGAADVAGLGLERESVWGDGGGEGAAPDRGRPKTKAMRRAAREDGKYRRA